MANKRESAKETMARTSAMIGIGKTLLSETAKAAERERKERKQSIDLSRLDYLVVAKFLWFIALCLGVLLAYTLYNNDIQNAKIEKCISDCAAINSNLDGGLNRKDGRCMCRFPLSRFDYLENLRAIE